jgi:prophage regulatory protein
MKIPMNGISRPGSSFSAVENVAVVQPGDHSRADDRVQYSRPIRLLRLPQVMEITSMRKTMIYALQAKGDFPRGVKLASQSVRWVEEEVLEWLARRLASHRVQ